MMLVQVEPITVLNAEGEIVRQQIGLGQDIGPIVRELETLVGKGI